MVITYLFWHQHPLFTVLEKKFNQRGGVEVGESHYRIFVPFTTELQNFILLKQRLIYENTSLSKHLWEDRFLYKRKKIMFSPQIPYCFTKGIGHGSTYSSIGVGAGVSVLSTMQAVPNAHSNLHLVVLQLAIMFCF